MTRENFSDRLTRLKHKVISMGALAENQLQDALFALFTNDRSIANKVIRKDDAINTLEDEIQQDCVTLLATQQPLARDLRAITAVLKIITDLERIGDHAADISDITIILEGEFEYPAHLQSMAKETLTMVKDAISAYVAEDTETAAAVAVRDDIVDNLFSKVLLEIETQMQSRPENIDASTRLTMAAKYLERIGDHATNIAEWVIYGITGQRNKLN